MAINYFKECISDGNEENSSHVDQVGSLWQLRCRVRSWPFRSWLPPSKSKKQQFSKIAIHENDEGVDGEEQAVKRGAGTVRTMKQWMEKDKFRPRSTVSSPTHTCKPCNRVDDDTDCPCGGCVAWGDRNKGTSSSVQAVMSELTLALLRHSIDTREWGKEGRKTIWDLVWEIQQGFTEVKVDHTEKEKRLTRFAHNLRIRIHAETKEKGLCILQEKNVKFAGKYVTKKMMLGDQDWRSKCVWILERYFSLDRSFITRHIVVLNQRVLNDNMVSTYYPPLFAKYTIHEVDLWIKNDNSFDVMGLPWGTDFETKVYDQATVKHREQEWNWQQVHQGKEIIKQEIHRAYAFGESFYKLFQEETEPKKTPRKSFFSAVVDIQAANKATNAMQARKSVAVGPRNSRRKTVRNAVVADLAKRRASRLPPRITGGSQKGNEVVVDSGQAWSSKLSWRLSTS